MKRAGTIAAIAFAGLLALGGGLDLYLHSAAFRTWIEQYVQGQLQQSLGAQVAIQNFDLRLWPPRLDFHHLVVHGREAAGQPALAVIPELRVDVHLAELLRGKVRLGAVTAAGPQFHVYPLADGNLNLPQPLEPWMRREHEAETVFALEADTVTITHGELDIEQRRIPLNLHVADAGLRLAAGPPGSGGAFDYQGELSFRQAQAVLGGLGPEALTLAMQFRLRTDGLDFSQATLTLPDAVIQAQGSLHDFLNPTIALRWQAQAGLAQWDRQLAQGNAQAVGSLQWRPGNWEIAGSVRAQDVQLAAAPGQEWQADGTFEATPKGLILPAWQMEGLGGRWRFNGREDGWKALALSGSVSGARLADAARLLPLAGLERGLTRRLQAGVSRLRANVEGTWSWQAGTAQAALRLTAPGDPAAAGALGGNVQAAWRAAGHQLQLRQLSLTSGGGTIAAQGSVTPAGADLRIALATPDWSRFETLAASFGLSGFPAIGGSGSFQGALQGSLAAPVVTGQIQASHLRLQTAARTWSADALTASGRLAPDGVHLDELALQLSTEQFHASGDVGLSDYRVSPASAIHLSLRGDRLVVATFEALAGVDYGLQGEFSASAELGGRWGAPAGTASFLLRQARWRNQTIPLVRAAFALRQDRLQSSNLELDLPHTQIRGSLDLGLRDHSYRVQVASGAVELADLALLQSPRLPLRGLVRFQLNGAGSWDRPAATLVLTSSGLQGAGESLGDWGARLELRPGTGGAPATVHVQSADILTNGSFNLEGEVGLAAPFPADLAVHLRSYDLDAWLRRFTSAELSGHSHVSGEATLRGPLAHPDQLTGTVTLDPLQLELAGLDLHNQGPVRFTASGRQLRLETIHMVGGAAGARINAAVGAGAPSTDFTMQAQASLGPTLASPAPLQGSVQGRVDLALIQSLHPDSHVAGTVAVNASLGGTLTDPRLQGELEVRDGSFAEGDLPISLDQVQGQIRLTDNRMQIVRLTAQTGSGSIGLNGYAARGEAGYSFDLNLTGQNLRLRYEGISMSGDLQLRLSGQQGGGLLAGSAQLNRVALGPNFDLAVFLATLQSNPTPPSPDSLLNRVRMDIHLVTGPQVEVATNLARLQLQADLQLRGTLAQPSVLGHAGASEGRLLFAGNQFQVTKAQVQFDNPYRLDPVLDIGLSTTVQQYDVSLNLSGPADKLAITYRSDPPLASADVVALLATGQPTQATAALAPTNATFAGTSEQILGQALDNLVAERLHRLFGITQVQVNPDTGPLGTTGSGGTVTIEQQVARNLKLTYTQNLASSAQDIVQVDWTVNRTVGLTLSRDQFGLYGIKFTFRQRAR